MPALNSNNSKGRVLLLAPTGRDAALISKVLEEAGVLAEACIEIEDFCNKLSDTADAAFITEEALSPLALKSLVETLNNQPPWSDFPLVVLTSGGGNVPANLTVLKALGEAGNITLIERPTRIITLVSALQAAQRARRRQYEVRDHLAEEKRAREERSHLLEEAEAANRMKDEFLATMSHELRTPLTAILGWVHLLRVNDLDESSTERAFDTIQRNARAQVKLIDDLLDISRIIAGKLRLDVRAVNLASIIEAAVDAARPTAEAKGVRLQMLIDPQASPVSGDADRLQQIVWNLLTNAIKFTPREGRVQVRLERVNSHLEITVSDSGKGISANFLPHVFDRFRQADGTSTRAHGGLGLGLSIVRQLVELHGGTVKVKSDGEGQGSIFIVELPLMVARREVNETERRRSIDGANKDAAYECPAELDGLRILIVDDEADTRDLLCAVLERCKASVITVGSAVEALETFRQLKLDVLISDIGMPEEDGYSLIGKVRAFEAGKTGQLPAIALTAYARVDDRVRALNAGFQVHIAKPVEPFELIAVVASLAKRTAKI